MASQLAAAITEMIRLALPSPNIKLGTVVSVLAPSVADDDSPLPGRVVVSGIADQDMPCDWSSGFDLELSALGDSLIGMRVEVHFDSGQPIIAYSIILGDKS